MDRSQTIVAVATGIGGAISVIRVGGDRAIEICDKVFRAASGKSLSSAKGYTLHYGTVVDSDAESESSCGSVPVLNLGEARESVIDDVVISLFRAPRSYTGQDMVEISCHGSTYIQQEITKLLIRNGARAAEPGEFTINAFLNGKLDLAQAEAVADMIAATDKATHALAMQQIRGGYSSEFQSLRAKLIELVSLLELELDFGEEEVEFADRTQLLGVIEDIEQRVDRLLKSFSLGNSLKNGIPVAIIGEPNVGKSTLLNALLNEDRAMVSEIAGTTRDVIEESLNIGGVRFRFIDTAGIRETSDKLEQMGIERTMTTIDRARTVMLLVDAQGSSKSICDAAVAMRLRDDQKLCVVINKIDRVDTRQLEVLLSDIGASVNCPLIAICAKSGVGVDRLQRFLSDGVSAEPLYHGDTVISNARHYDALTNAKSALHRSHQSMTEGLATDLLSQDIKESLHYLGMITGEITTNDILSSIFSKFCIGK